MAAPTPNVSPASKVMSLGEAAALVRDGDHLGLGGFACTRNAMAFTHELIRQGRHDLTISGAVLGMEAD
ncbi:MAG: glutaconate CoA-transferase, subunit, partial [Chloroflexota bacterium]|nr:glutaconate CoA-transferase, subunit [Chloroflexota bacterium]